MSLEGRLRPDKVAGLRRANPIRRERQHYGRLDLGRERVNSASSGQSQLHLDVVSSGHTTVYCAAFCNRLA